MRELQARALGSCLLFAGLATPLAAQQESVTVLDDLQVIGTPIFLYDSDRQLAQIRQSLPTLGSDIPALAGFAETLQGLLFGDPNALRADQQAMLLRTSGEHGPQNLP